MRQQLTNTILMVAPTDFSFNEQTAQDNEFQHKPDNMTADELKLLVRNEFDNAVAALRLAGVNVLVLEKPPGLPQMPDAVFPNNWFATDEEGRVYVFPMCTENRRAETMQLEAALHILKLSGFIVNEVVDLTKNGVEGFLEGTGSMIFDRQMGRVYASRSVRTDEEKLQEFLDQSGFEKAIVFDAISSNGMPFYHTNVVMSIGDGFTVITLDSVPEGPDKEKLIDNLSMHRDVVEISKVQAEQYFCGNILQLATGANTSVIVMSTSAYDGFTDDQLDELSDFGTLLPISIPTIEKVGGGSARCMMAEIFLPRIEK